MKIFFLFFLLLGSLKSFSQSQFLSEKSLPTTALLFNKLKNQKSFINSRDQKINWTYLTTDSERHPKPFGTIVISPGRTESSLNWSEYCLALRDQGYSIAIVDHVGQGLSDRLIKNSDIGHVDKFESYVEDFNLFLAETKKQFAGPYFLIGNSMGAPIALISDAMTFEKIVLHAPMFKIKTSPVPYSMARWLSEAMVFLSISNGYAPLTGSFKPAEFSKNRFASSEPRYNFDVSQLMNNPQSIVGGPSVQWVYQATRVPDLITSRFQDIKTPMLIFQAENEHFVDNEFQNFLCLKNPNCQIQPLKNTLHVLHLEVDPVINDVFSKTIDYFKN